jgi:hypothetical protein
VHLPSGHCQATHNPAKDSVLVIAWTHFRSLGQIIARYHFGGVFCCTNLPQDRTFCIPRGANHLSFSGNVSITGSQAGEDLSYVGPAYRVLLHAHSQPHFSSFCLTIAVVKQLASRAAPCSQASRVPPSRTTYSPSSRSWMIVLLI